MLILKFLNIIINLLQRWYSLGVFDFDTKNVTLIFTEVPYNHVMSDQAGRVNIVLPITNVKKS